MLIYKLWNYLPSLPWPFFVDNDIFPIYCSGSWVLNLNNSISEACLNPSQTYKLEIFEKIVSCVQPLLQKNFTLDVWQSSGDSTENSHYKFTDYLAFHNAKMAGLFSPRLPNVSTKQKNVSKRYLTSINCTNIKLYLKKLYI